MGVGLDRAADIVLRGSFVESQRGRAKEPARERRKEKEEEKIEKNDEEKNEGPGLVMVSRIGDNYFSVIKSKQGSESKRDDIQ